MTQGFDNWENERQKIIGFGPQSIRKSYYQELRSNLSHLQRFRAIFDQSSEGLLIIDAETWKIVETNRATTELTGLGTADLLESDPDRFLPGLRKLCPNASTGMTTHSITFIPEIGKPFPIEASLQYTEFQGRGFVIVTLRDVRELVRSLQELRENQENLQTLFDSSLDAIIVHDFENQIIAVNRRASLLFGFPPEKAKDLSVLDISSPEFSTQSRIETNLQMLEQNGEYLFEWEGVNLTTNEPLALEVLLRRCVWFGQDAAIAFIRDIRQRRREVAERRRIEEQFQQAQKMESIGRLAGGVAHDFNNMLTVIIGYAEMAIKKLEPDQPLIADLREIRQAAEQSANLTRQLLAFARKQTVSPQLIELNETVEGTLKMLRRLIGEDIDLKWLPHSHATQILIDPAQIDQILANLCINARDAMGTAGTITIETDIASIDENYTVNHPEAEPGRYIQLTVSDTGSGMSKDVLDHLFEPFFTTKEMGKGTGLGLATVYGIMKQNNGFINVYSEIGMGTTFRLYFPRQAEDETTLIETDEVAALETGTETVMIVEDGAAILKMAELMLSTLGYTAIAVASPEEAVRVFDLYGGKIHLLITDVVMPGMNGRELCQRLKARKPNLKCLYMSGYTADVIAHHGVLEEGVHFIQKPFTIETLAAHIRKALG
jgi:PAS domain S-box-containing protein